MGAALENINKLNNVLVGEFLDNKCLLQSLLPGLRINDSSLRDPNTLNSNFPVTLLVPALLNLGIGPISNCPAHLIVILDSALIDQLVQVID